MKQRKYLHDKYYFQTVITTRLYCDNQAQCEYAQLEIMHWNGGRKSKISNYNRYNSNKSQTWCNNFRVYYPDVYLQLNMFRAFSRPSSGAQWLQWQPLVLPSYRGDSRAVFVVGPAPDTKLENCCIWLVIYLNYKMRVFILSTLFSF